MFLVSEFDRLLWDCAFNNTGRHGSLGNSASCPLGGRRVLISHLGLGHFLSGRALDGQLEEGVKSTRAPLKILAPRLGKGKKRLVSMYCFGIRHTRLSPGSSG